MRECRDCHRSLSTTDFYRDATGRGGLRGICKFCEGARAKARRLANPERAAAINRAWRLANPERVAENMRAWRLANDARLTEMGASWRRANSARVREAARLRARRIKEEGIAAYGGACICCGERDSRFLTIDHINGLMGEKRTASGTSMWNRMRRMNWPTDNYQLLCFNCNCAKGFLGACPHKIAS